MLLLLLLLLRTTRKDQPAWTTNFVRMALRKILRTNVAELTSWILELTERLPRIDMPRFRGELLRSDQLLACACSEPVVTRPLNRHLVVRYHGAAELFDAVLHRILDSLHDLHNPLLLAIALDKDLPCHLRC